MLDSTRRRRKSLEEVVREILTEEGKLTINGTIPFLSREYSKLCQSMKAHCSTTSPQSDDPEGMARLALTLVKVGSKV